MRRASILIIVLILLGTTINVASAQNGEITTDSVKGELYLTEKNNIPESCRDYEYDSRGNLWHVGYHKRIMRITPHYMQTFDFSNSDYIFQSPLCVYEDQFNELWIGTDRGIARFNYRTERFKSYASKFMPDSLMYYQGAKAMCRLSKELILIGTGSGYFIYNINTDEISNDIRDNEIKENTFINKNSARVMELNKLNKDEIFIMLDTRLRILNWKTGIFSEYELPDAKSKPRDSWAMNIYQYGNGLYVPVARKELWKFNLEDKKWQQIPFNSSVQNTHNTQRHNNIFLSTYHISDRYFTLNSRRGGVIFYDMAAEQYQNLYIKNPAFSKITYNENIVNLKDKYLNFVNFTYLDNQGYLWANHTSRYLVRSAHPILKPNNAPNDKSLNILAIKIAGKPLDSLALDKETEAINLKRYERNVSFGLNANFSISSNSTYMYKVNNGVYEKVKKFPIQLKDLNAGKNKIEFKVIDREEVLAESDCVFYIEPYWHERWINRLLLLLLILFIPTIFYLFRLQNLKKINSEKERLNKKLSEMEMTVLKAQMNPHFLFNSLNSIKYYAITKSKNETASYINTFSKLIRQVLNNSDEKMVSLTDEIKALQLYLEVESRRFEKGFEYSIETDATLNTDVLYVIPLLIQPYVENAIWHGILHKHNGGSVQIHVKDNESELEITITDNGVGREVAKEIKRNKKKEKSFGTKLTQNRIELVKELYDISASINIIDLYHPSGEALGTKVKIIFPKLNTAS